MQKRCRIWQNLRCTRLYTNTRSSTTWRIADQTRTFICVFLQACAISQYTGNAFWKQNEKRLSERCIPELKLWISSSRCWKRPRQLKKPFIGAAESCASWSTLVRWPNARDDLAFQANPNWNFMTLSFSFECKMNFRKFFVGSPGNEDSITKTAKVPQSVQAVFLSFFFFFFFYHFRCFFFFCQKADPQASETKKRGRSYIPVVHLHSELALATTCTLRVLSQ